MIIKSSKKYEGLRPMVIDNDKLNAIKKCDESNLSALERFMNSKHHLTNPDDWMIAQDNESMMIFNPRLSNYKIGQIVSDLGVIGG